MICILSGYISNQIDTNADNRKYLPDNSFALNYIDSSENAFNNEILNTIYIVILNKDFSNQYTRNLIINFTLNFENNDISCPNQKCHILSKIDHWLFEFETYLNNTYNISSFNEFDNLYNYNETIHTYYFYYYLKQFTNNTNYKRWKTSIIYDNINNPTTIIATKFTVDVSKSTNFNIIWQIRDHWTNVLKNSLNINNNNWDNYGFFFDDTFGIAYISSIVVRLTIINIILACVGVFIVLFFVVDIKLAIFCIFIIIMIDIDLFGWLIINDIALDTLTYVQLVALHYTLHVCIYACFITYTHIHTYIGGCSWIDCRLYFTC